MKLKDKLLDVTADLISSKESQPFLKKLFSLPMGTWIEVSELVSGLPRASQETNTLQKVAKGQLKVTWLDLPDSVHGNGYCIVLFLMEEIYWDNLFIFNKQQFDDAA